MTALAVDWQRIRAVVFDVDGTLYGQRAMRLRMLRELGIRCLARPTTVADARILKTFRQLREVLANDEATGISRLQYEGVAQTLGLPQARIVAVVDEWILERPLRHVAACRNPGVRRFFSALRQSGRRIGVWSDYPAAAKVEAMDLTADAVVAATDPEVDRMKPLPAGLERVCELLAVSPSETLMIGDRDDRDGEAARRFGCSYLLLNRRPASPVEFADYAALARSLSGPDNE